MNILVTGGAGFIGSHIAHRFVQMGHRVRIFDNLSTGKLQNLEGFESSVEFVRGDVREAEHLRDAMKGIHVVFHEAAIVSVPYSVEHPQETHDVNLQGTLNVIQAARAQGARRVVFASSAAVYGVAPEQPKAEFLVPSPVSPYGVEKLASEHYLHVAHRLYGLETVALRYFNVFGPRQDPSSPYSGVISIFVNRALEGRAPTIFGDGAHSRDFVFVDNVVDANVAAATSPSVSGQVFNVGCGQQTTLLDLVTQLQTLSGRTMAPHFAPERAGDIRQSMADISRARQELGYEPKVSAQEGLRRLWDYEAKRFQSVGG